MKTTIPTLSKLSVEKHGARNEYGEREVILRAEPFTRAGFTYHPILAEIKFGTDEQDRKQTAEEIARRVNNYEKLETALKNLLDECGQVDKATLTTGGRTTFLHAVVTAINTLKQSE